MENIWAIGLFALVTSITPGPNNIMVMASGVNHGVKKTIPHVVGICVGFPIMVCVLGFGFGLFLLENKNVSEIMMVVGTVYLFYLAWQIAFSKFESDDGEIKNGQPLTFIQSALFQWMNPKAWVMASSAIVTFCSVDIHYYVFILAFIFFCISIPSVLLWLYFGKSLKLFLSNPQKLKVFNILMAILLVVSSISVYL